MAEYTVEQYRAGAKKAMEAGDMATAKKLIARGMALQAQRTAATPEGDRSNAQPKSGVVPQEVLDRLDAAKAGTLEIGDDRLAEQRALDQQFVDERAIEASGGKGKTAAREFIAGVPFAGEYADELYGAVHGDAARAEYNAGREAFRRTNPKTALAANVAGGVVGSIPMAVAAAPAVSAAAPASLGARMLAGATAAGTTGALEGAVSGYGAGEDGNRAQTAFERGKLGAAFGAGAGAIAPAAAHGIKAIAEYVKSTDIGIIARTFGISRKAADVLKTDLSALDFSAAQRNLDVAGPSAMLADAGIPTREALDAAITGGGKAARIGTDAVSERAAFAGKRLGQVMDTLLGAPQGVKSAAKSIAARTSAMRQTAYDRAYATAIDYADNAGRNIEDVLARIPAGTLKSAIGEANDAMQAAGARNMQIMAEIAPDGAVTFREMPNVQQLDEIKKALGSVAATHVDQFGRPTAAGKRARKLAGDLKDAIAAAVPSYGRAVKLGGDKIAEDQSLDLGRKLFLQGTSRETVAETMKGASVEAQEAARRGIREYIDDTLARVRRSIDDPSVDTQETRRLLDTLSSRDARDKLRIVLGAPKADRLFAEIDAVGKQFGTRMAIATGSQTGRREARRAALDDALAPGVLGNAQQGKGIATVQSVVRFLTRETPQAMAARRQEVLADVAKALTTMRGQDAKDALTAVQRAIAGQPIKSQEAARIANLLASSGALAGYQAGTKALEEREIGR